MSVERIDRIGGNPVYSCVTCIVPLLLDYIIASAIDVFVPQAFAGAFVALLIPMGIFYLWFGGWLMRGRWYLEYDDGGVTYRAFMTATTVSWFDVSDVYTKNSAGLEAKYHDILVIQSEGKPLVFFLPDYGFDTPRSSKKFIQDITEKWANANPSTGSNRESTQKPTEGDAEDSEDDDYY